MNLNGNEQVNVVSLFGSARNELLIQDDFLTLDEDLTETEVAAEAKDSLPRNVVQETQFPDQSIYILQAQLSSLRTNLNRLKFYLGDVEDLLPHKN